jgi:hypothetical protein
MPAAQPLSIAASAPVSAGPAYVYEIYVEAGADVATVELANQATSGGTRLLGARAGANGQTTRSFPKGAYFDTAVYATVTGTAPVIEIVWSKEPA